MSPPDPTPAELLKEDAKLLARIDDHGKGLTPWEVERVAEWLEQVNHGRPLSWKQRKLLERIDDERVR